MPARSNRFNSVSTSKPRVSARTGEVDSRPPSSEMKSVHNSDTRLNSAFTTYLPWGRRSGGRCMNCLVISKRECKVEVKIDVRRILNTLVEMRHDQPLMLRLCVLDISPLTRLVRISMALSSRAECAKSTSSEMLDSATHRTKKDMWSTRRESARSPMAFNVRSLTPDGLATPPSQSQNGGITATRDVYA
jgi:hypothetical protein